MSAKVIDKDLGWKKLLDSLKVLDGGTTKVGVHQGTEHRSKDSGKTKTSDLVKIAAANELGTKHIPARAAMRKALDDNLRKLNNFKSRLLNGVYSGKLHPKRALGLLGAFHTAQVKKKITDLKTPPNAPATIKKKKSSNPLIDTSQFRGSINHVENV